MKSFRYEFTMNELSYFLFGKKNCPKCGEQYTLKELAKKK